MAWVTQTFTGDGLAVALGASRVIITPIGPGAFTDADGILHIEPTKQAQAHEMAMMFRRVARRLEEIGKGLP